MYTYKQSTGQLFDSSGNLLGTGWAGQGDGKNNPDMQDVKNIGPLPQGRYTIGPAYHHPRLGPVTMDLTPSPSNQMFDRADFRIHGASATDPEHSSEGCMIQIRIVRESVASGMDKDLEVIA